MVGKRVPGAVSGLIAFLFLTTGCAFLNGCAFLKDSKYIDESDFVGSIRVACIGDSITYGYGIENREENSYPAQLDDMLGDKWEVRNFGVNGATLMKKGDLPYWEQEAYREALEFKPHVVIIKLGTNDTKPRNWKHKEEFVSDYVDLIKSFSSLESNPGIWICYPVPAYPKRWGIRDSVIKGEVLPKIDLAAKKTQVPVIDLYTALSNKGELFPDKVHPNAEGARIMAEEICYALTGRELTLRSRAGEANRLLCASR